MASVMPKVLGFCSLLALPIISQATTVTLYTNQGDIVVELADQAAPKSVANFIRYVQDGSYQGSLFHRVIPGFVVQGGGYNERYQSLPTYNSVANESDNGLPNKKGSLAMARTQDPNSATRQFYFNLADNAFLNSKQGATGYTVFGQVTTGLDVLEKMTKVPTTFNSVLRAKDVPSQPIVLERIEIMPPPAKPTATAKTTAPKA